MSINTNQPERAQSQRMPQGWLALVGLLLALFLGGLTFGGWLVAANLDVASGPVMQDDDEADGKESKDAKPIDKVREVNRAFKSESGNLQCSVGEFSGEPGAICHQVNINYAVPAGLCPSAHEGVFVGLGSSGAYWPCVSTWGEPDEVLAYDTPVTQAGVTCVINYETGVTCTNEAGKGFAMEFNAGVSTF